MKANSKILLLFIIVATCSCKDEYTICDLSKDVVLKSGFYEKTSAGERMATAASFSLKQLGAVDFIYKNSSNVTQFSIPLNPVADSVKFVISISQSSPSDTITVVYSTQNVNLSTACGDVLVNKLIKVSTTINTLDSIKIASSVVNTTSGENVKIYF